MTFNLPGSPDSWGMMCEADLEEVYRHRSLNFKFMSIYTACVGSAFLLNAGLHEFTDWSNALINSLTLLTLIIGAQIFQQRGPSRLSRRLAKMTEIIHAIVEGGGNLQQRLDTRKLANDETGDLGKWTNSFIDDLDHIVSDVIRAADEVMKNSPYVGGYLYFLHYLSIIRRHNYLNQIRIELSTRGAIKQCEAAIAAVTVVPIHRNQAVSVS